VAARIEKQRPLRLGLLQRFKRQRGLMLNALVDAIAKIDKQVDAATAKMDAEVAAGQAPFRSLIALYARFQVSPSWRQEPSSPKSAPT
jgi:hypothetical protein